MTSGSSARHILHFTVPLILTNMGQQLYMIVDGAFVGRGVGVKALAAVGSTDWCYWLILWTVGGLAQGFSTFVSRSFGERNYSEMNKTIATATELCFFIGLFFYDCRYCSGKTAAAYFEYTNRYSPWCFGLFDDDDFRNIDCYGL